MMKIRYFFIILFISIILLLIPNISNAAVEVTREVYSNNGSMNFYFTGLELDIEKEYEFGFTTTAAAEVEDWFEITDYTETTATVNITTTTSELREVFNATDTGYIRIRETSTEEIVLEPYAVDLQIPYLLVTNYTMIENGTEFGSWEENTINVPIRNASVSEAYYQYEKITDENIINQYLAIKEAGGDYYELQDILSTSAPTAGWSIWGYWNGHTSSAGMNGFGYPESPISAPDSGLYYLWVYFSGDGIKDIYGYILVDNLDDSVQADDEDNDDTDNTGNTNNTGGTNNSGNTNNTGNANNSGNTSNTFVDNTIASGTLPYTGKIGMGIIIIAVIIICAGTYFKYNKFKGI